MSKTIVDMAKVTQMLDAGWRVQMWRGGLNTYVVAVRHKPEVMQRAADAYDAKYPDAVMGLIDEDGEIVTDDFTPEQALTRMAYKVHGEVI